MLKNQNIICISSIDWDFVWQGHQEIMSIFAANGNKVLFIENTGVRFPHLKDMPRLKKRVSNWFKSIKGFRKENENLYIYSPLILPFPYFRLARWINKHLLLGPLERWMRVMDFNKPIIWTFLPTGTALDIINNLEKKLLVYYCIANFYELADNFKKVRKTEDELIKKSDLIFAQGLFLKDKCMRLNKNVYIFPFGVKIETFHNIQGAPEEKPQDLKRIDKPIIGYIGGIHRHIDFGLLKGIAEAHPEWSIVLVGPLQTNISEIKNILNIFLLGKKEFDKLAIYINEFDVCIIPYNKTEYTRTVYPTKLNEYHAMGKPVVSTDLPEILNFNRENDNLVLVAKSRDEFMECIQKALKDKDDSVRAKRISSARNNCWINRIEEMSDLIERTITSKSKLTVDWKERFLRLYYLSRKRIFKLFFIFSTVYLAIFYTPLIWYLTSPLKISQLPQSADCIVVFAGGVGESGKAGQGYEERVQYAVELYRMGFAKHMLFSSGYAYVYKEPLVMKVLAVSLGVPEEAIILEEEAKNTYENVKFSNDILAKNNWNKILLVSSPYHIRRVSLVFNKIAKNIRVRYLPITNSLFYSHPNRDEYGRRIWKRINMQQIKGILHEYLGVIYYWQKGWI